LKIYTDLYFSPGTIVTSEESKKARQKVWKEILEVLKKVDGKLEVM
jgi:hypothetical protein